MGNPRVIAGEHATHLLIRREYIDSVGASWDTPGLIASESYMHNFVDDEIVLAARQRNVWTMALGARVEHMHPLWGKHDDDSVYHLGESFFEVDMKTWNDRLVKYGTVDND
jgi:hypothetical protein